VSTVKFTDYEILTAGVDGHVRIYDMRMGTLTDDHLGSSITDCHFSSEGKCILANTLANKLLLLDKQSGNVLSEYKGHKSEKYKVQCSFNNDDGYVLCGSEDGNVFCWDIVDVSQ
jgi:mitogen-activated protein kinase organizer 1